jgi:hypothetical protein
MTDTASPALRIGGASMKTFTFEGKTFVVQHDTWTNRSDLKMSSPMMVSIRAMR